MDKVYIITAGSYSDYHIVAVFDNKDKAYAFSELYDRKSNALDDDCSRVEEYIIGADTSIADKILYCAVMHDDGSISAFRHYAFRLNILDYVSSINNVREEDYNILSCLIAVDVNKDDPEEYARKVAADLFAEYKARKEGIT